MDYASLWLLSRATPSALEPKLLKANHIDLRVLAPPAYYAPFELAELEYCIDHGVGALVQQRGVQMTFGFNLLPPALLESPFPDSVSLLDGLTTCLALHGDR